MRITKAKVHFIGIGGIGMSGIAELLHNLGASVSGSDLSDNNQTKHLSNLGVKVFKGHEASNLTDVDVVVYSSAVKPSNVEYQEAINKGIPLIPRAEALAEVMRMKRGIAVAGTHGKTTTTSLLSSVFIHAQFDPTIVVGGRLDIIKSTSKLGSGEWMLAEADESDGSFLKLSPELAIITNIDKDHLDYFKNETTLRKSFFDFACQVPFYGSLIACGDDSTVRETFRGFSKKCVFYGFDDSNEFRLVGERQQFKIFHNQDELGEVKMPMPGRHNALNALAAIVAGLLAGIPFKDAVAGVEAFNGVDRRFQFKGTYSGVDYYDDYGHHPTEVRAVLTGFKEKFPNRNLKVMFQPHRYTRTRDCWNDFKNCFQLADELYLLDIYEAGESPIEGVSSQALTSEITEVKVTHIAGFADDEILRQMYEVQSKLQENDIFLSLGAGSVSRLAESLIAKVNN